MTDDAPERVVNHDVLPIDTRMSTASGSLSSPMGASAEVGKLINEWLVERVVAIVDDEFSQTFVARDGQQVSRAVRQPELGERGRFGDAPSGDLLDSLYAIDDGLPMDGEFLRGSHRGPLAPQKGVEGGDISLECVAS